MRLDKASKAILQELVRTVPGSELLLAAFDDDVDRLLTKIFKKEQVDELEVAARTISEAISISASPYYDKNPGASVSAAYDFLQSVSDARITFEELLSFDFQINQVIGHFENFRPTDWNYASGQRKQLWQSGIEQFSKFIIHFYLTTPRYHGYLLVEILKRQRNQPLNYRAEAEGTEK